MSDEISLHAQVLENYSKHDSHLRLIANLRVGVGSVKKNQEVKNCLTQT